MSLRDKKREAILGLRVIAAEAEMLAMKLEKNQLWGGDYQRGVNKIAEAMQGLPDER